MGEYTVGRVNVATLLEKQQRSFSLPLTVAESAGSDLECQELQVCSQKDTSSAFRCHMTLLA